MKLRPSLLVAPVVVGLSLGVLAPAQAASTDPVVGLTATAVQAPGSHDAFKVSASWTDNGASRYTVQITDVAGNPFGSAKDVIGSPAALISDNLVADASYWLHVTPDGGTDASVEFTTPALDTTAPTGTYRVAPSVRYLGGGDLLSGTEDSAAFQITGSALEKGATRKVVAGDGTAAKSWPTGSSYALRYTKAGTYTPHVVLADAFGNTRDLTLTPVRVLEDDVAPVLAISVPATPTKASSWRVVRGTATDTGTGVALLVAFVMEKRGHTWWAYDFHKKKWLKGETSRRKTESKSKAQAALMLPSASGAWHTPRMKGMTKGTLYIQAIAADQNFNLGVARPVTRKVR